MKKTDLCPCCSGKPYGDCCNVFLGSTTPTATAEQLMRSRYTAFVLQKAQYLVDTHHPDFRSQDELKSLKKSFKGMVWHDLEIIHTELGQVVDATGVVEFKASFSCLGKHDVIHERSSFVKEQEQWFYTTGTMF